MGLDTTENKITIVLTPIGMIIGRMAEGVLTSPRHLVIKRDETGERIALKDMIGSPELFFIGNAPYYFSEEPILNESFVEVVSGIRVIHPEVA